MVRAPSQPIVSPEWLLACQRASKLVPIAPYYLGQTNRAASLSSAQLVASPPSHSQSLTGAARGARPVQAVAPSPSQPVVPTTASVPEEEEPAPAPEANAVPAPAPPPAPKPVLELQEDVEAPPPEQRELQSEPAPEPEVEQVDEATDSSTRGIKSDGELHATAESDETAGLPAAALGGQDSTGDAEKEQVQEEEEPATGVAELEVKPDAPGDELAQEQEEASAPAPAPAPETLPTVAAAEEPQLDAVEAGESDVDADVTKEAEKAGKGEEGRAEEPGSKQAAEEEEEEEDAAGETSLVDVTL